MHKPVDVPPGWDIEVRDVHDGFGSFSAHSILLRLVTRRRGPFWRRRDVREWVVYATRYCGVYGSDRMHEKNVEYFKTLIRRAEEAERA